MKYGAERIVVVATNGERKAKMSIIEMKSIWPVDGAPIKVKIECGSYPIDLYFHFSPFFLFRILFHANIISSRREQVV